MMKDKALKLLSQDPPARPLWTQCPSLLLLQCHAKVSPSPVIFANLFPLLDPHARHSLSVKEINGKVKW